MLYSLYTSASARSVALILELKIHTKDRNIHVYTCANFQEHAQRGREDIRVALQTSDHKTLVFFLFFLVRTDAKKSGTNTRAPLHASLSSSKAASGSSSSVGQTLLLSRSFS
jgi:hypothetical protein